MILNFQEIDHTKWSLVGGKGANLGELTSIDGIQVPVGFCITTDVYNDIIRNIELRIDQGDIPGSCARIRAAIESVSLK